MINPEQPDISRRLRNILDIAKQRHGYIPKKQSQNGIIPMKEQSGGYDHRFHIESGNTPSRNMSITTNFSAWIHDCNVAFIECGDIKSCMKDVPSTHGRFISEHDSRGGIFLRTTDNTKGTLHLTTPHAIKTFGIHLAYPSNFRK